MKKNKLFLIILVIFVFLITGLFFVKNISNKKSISKTEIFLKLNNEKNFKPFILDSEKTALEFMKENSKVVYKGEGSNAYITAIDGIEAKAENKEFWAFYINGKMADVGAGSYILKKGDKIEWKIEKY